MNIAIGLVDCFPAVQMLTHWCKSHAKEDLCRSGEPEWVEPNDLNVSVFAD